MVHCCCCVNPLGVAYMQCCEGQGSRLFGSLPEYIYSISTNRSSAGSNISSGFYVNLFAAVNDLPT